MGLWGKVLGFFTGDTGGKVIAAADKLHFSAQERGEADAKDLGSAREMTAPSHDSGFDILVDAFSRLVRPGVTFWMIGGFIGWWTLPRIETISDYWQNIFMLVLTFWFGGRAVLKDLPAAVRSMRK
jgi:hypothetical protein